MSDPLGLSIGTANLVAARVGNPPVVRRAVLSLFDDRAPQLGEPADDTGVELTGFVQRVGDPVPLVASDGTSYHADQLVVEALDALIEAAGGEPPAGQLAISVPAHWDSGALRAMRAAMRGNPSLAPNGVPARLVPDAVAALTALHADPGLPSKGVVALLDFGAGGTSITLADAAAAFEPVATTRATEFAGDQIDEALLAHVLDGAAHTGDAAALSDETAGTAEVSALMTLRDACRTAKEQLSTADTAQIPIDLPGYDHTVQITRAELEPLLTEPLAEVLEELDKLLQRNNIPWSKVKSVATVGGGAQIPLVADAVADHVAAQSADIPVVSTLGSAADAAVGATLFAAYGADADAQTGMASAAELLGTAAMSVADLDDEPKTEAEPAPAAAAPSSGFRALAWSDDDAATDDVLPYTGDESYDNTTRAVAQYVPPVGAVTVEQSKALQRFPLVAFGIAAVAVLIAGGVAIKLTGESNQAPAPAPTTSSPPPVLSSIVPPPPPPPPPPVQAPPSTVTVTEAPPPPPPPPPAPTYEPPVTHAPPHTAVTHAPTTTPPPVTTTTPPPPPPPPTTTEPPPTTTTPTMTTAYVRLPFVPVPIPIQVPKGADPTTPANQYNPGYQQYPGYQQSPGYQEAPGYSPYAPNQQYNPYQPYQP